MGIITQNIDAAALGIDLRPRTEAPHFKWLLACILFGKPIQQHIARRAHAALIDAGITSLEKLHTSDWDTLVRLLDAAHYVRYDFSTATKLLEIAGDLRRQYGSITKLIRASADAHDLMQRLEAFKGIGPVTAGIFVRDVAPIWFGEHTPHDYQTAQLAAEILHSHGYDAYIIGGAVRDVWLGRQPKDFDLVTNATPPQLLALREFSGAFYKDTAQAYGVTRVSVGPRGSELEIATFRKDLEAHRGRKATKVAFAALEDDVLRRDFTINALALDPGTNCITDYVGGMEDLERGIVRFIGDPLARIREDPLRIMRAIRFKNQLGFQYHASTMHAIRQAVRRGQIEAIAVDRLRDELTRLLLHSSRRQAMIDLDNFGILARVLPEVTAGKAVPQPRQFHAEGDVWQHQLLVLSYLPDDPSKRLAWAALLHDIGKPATTIEPTQPGKRIRTDRHYAVGAELAKAALRRLRFSNQDISYITWMVYNHLAIDDLPSMRPSNQQRMLGHPAFADLLELHRADAAASWRPRRLRHHKPQFRAIERLWHTYQTAAPHIRQPSLKRDLGIDGNWLLEYFGGEFHLAHNPLLGVVLRELEAWYQDQGARDQRAYLQKARELLETHQPAK